MEVTTLGLLEDFAKDQLESFLRAILPFILIAIGVFLLLVSLIPWFLRILIAIILIIVGVVMSGWIPGVG